MKIGRFLKSLFAACSVAIASTALADYPERAVRIVVPWPAGGGADFVARTIGKELADQWKQPVIIENLGGAGSIIGAERAARATPDGYTLMLTINGTITSNRFLYRTLPYDPDKSFMPVSLLVQSGQLLLANKELKADTLAELVELARREPERLAYASYGNGTQPHLSFELLKKRERLNIMHVPYKGLAPALTAVMSNEAQVTLVSPSSASAALSSGRVKAIAIGSEQRSSILPDVPTVAQAGYPYMAASVWFGLFAPAGTPPEVIRKILLSVQEILKNPELAGSLRQRGFDVVGNTPEQFTALIREETLRTQEMAQAANVRPE